MGSEMCIRDRPVTVGPFANVHIVAIVLCEIGAQPADAQLVRDPCIVLITSVDWDGLRCCLHEQIGGLERRARQLGALGMRADELDDPVARAHTVRPLEEFL